MPIIAKAARGAALLGIAVALTGPAGAADAEKGERLARRWCAECHVVTPDQTRASADVPTFAEIAARPNLSDTALASLLATPDKAHSRMQALDLGRSDVADLIAHIRRQRP